MGFLDIAGGTGSAAKIDVPGVRGTGQDNDRNMAQFPVPFDVGQDPASAHFGHVQIQQDDVRDGAFLCILVLAPAKEVIHQILAV